jgi:hypothetical protein
MARAKKGLVPHAPARKVVPVVEQKPDKPVKQLDTPGVTRFVAQAVTLDLRHGLFDATDATGKRIIVSFPQDVADSLCWLMRR